MATPLPNQLLRRSFVKTVLRRLIALITVVGLVYGLIAVVYATKTIFKVKMNYAVVLERFPPALFHTHRAGSPANEPDPPAGRYPGTDENYLQR